MCEFLFSGKKNKKYQQIMCPYAMYVIVCTLKFMRFADCNTILYFFIMFLQSRPRPAIHFPIGCGTSDQGMGFGIDQNVRR